MRPFRGDTLRRMIVSCGDVVSAVRRRPGQPIDNNSASRSSNIITIKDGEGVA